ncbi:MAG TPA: c-type cytochrome [Thermoanaerobaculia bacterium]|nr:c-type cytochrome [Thermoanaerobaculia bacterium]
MRKAMFVLVLLAAAARADQKNVKLLTGLTDLELQRTMNMMRASMGTHCDYCHVLKDKWDFASDDNPHKRRARKMIEMVMELNKTNFNGLPVVSCYTCHRGSPKPVNLVELPQTAPPKPVPGPPPPEPQLLAAKDIVARYAAALGDASKLKLPRVMKGERTNYEGTKPFELTDKTDLFPLPAPWEIGEEAKTIAKENDRWVVSLPNQRLYFDTNSGLLVRKVLFTPTSIGRIPEQFDYEDYRDAGGVEYPFRMRVSLVDPWRSATRVHTSVEITP